MDTHGTEPDAIGPAPSVARLLLELRGRTSVDVRPSGRTLQVRPVGTTAVAVYIHPGGVDIAVDPEQANDVALSIDGAYVKDPDDPNCFVSIGADLIDANYDALLDLAVQAVELRVVAKAAPAKARATATRAATRSAAPKAAKAPTKAAIKAAAKAAAKPAPRPDPPRCSKCRQYELLASGECPSGYC